MKVYFHECGYRYWTWHDLYLELTLHLKKYHNATIVADKGHEWIPNPGVPDKLKAVPKLYVDMFNYHMPDCEIIIYDESSDILRAISFGESRSRLLDFFIERQNPADVLLITQQHNIFFNEFQLGLTKDTLPFKFKVKGTPFYTFDPTVNVEYFYNQRQYKTTDQLIDKMVCLTTPGTQRFDLVRLHELGVLDYGHGFTYANYLSELLKYKIGLSIAGSAEICHREFEYMALGIPNMHLTYMTELNPPLIPDYHYIAVDNTDFPKDMWLNRKGGTQYVDAYIKRFMEVKDDRSFLDFITCNARQYYLDYCSPHNRLAHILNLLEM
jgi:hypothetical protein